MKKALNKILLIVAVLLFIEVAFTVAGDVLNSIVTRYPPVEFGNKGIED